jgi:hypothetical protein
LADLSRRDQADAQNTYLAPDAIAIRTEGLSPDELLKTILELLK